jgi:NAD(P)H-hydrate repair Nnr-like enzyme with NAD(P)H-hydrate dehydratase domain
MKYQPRKGRPDMAFRVLIIGGTGQVGAAVVRALAAEPSCVEVVMVNRREVAPAADPRMRQVILDTVAAQFPTEVTKLAQGMITQGDPVYAASCVGVGAGSMKWSEEELKALEIGVVGALPEVAMPGVSPIFPFSPRWEATRKAGFAMCGSWG